MKIVIFDTETNGLPKSGAHGWHFPDAWPVIVSVAWQLWEQETPTAEAQMIDEYYTIVRTQTFPKEWSMAAQHTHGITHGQMMQGTPEQEVARRWRALAAQAEGMVAHNFRFDNNVMRATLGRYKKPGQTNPWEQVGFFDTMTELRQYARVPYKDKRRGFKNPTLGELYRVVFNRSMTGAHNALDDVKACAQIFFELRRRRVILGFKPGSHQDKTRR